jgi:hypothetical protein
MVSGPMNMFLQVFAIPPFRQRKGEWMGRGTGENSRGRRPGNQHRSGRIPLRCVEDERCGEEILAGAFRWIERARGERAGML